LTEKNQGRLRQFLDPRKQDALLALPQTLMKSAARNPKPHKGAIAAQTAVAIEILLPAPMRIENLAALDLETNFVHLNNCQAMRIVLSADEVKNREPADYPMSLDSAELIQRYLTEFRPRLASPGCTALFPGRKGGAKSVSALRDQIYAAIRRYAGAEMNPHLFRHFAAKNYLDAHPGDYETVRRFLGHRSIMTTTNFYAGFETAAAVRCYDGVLRKLREKAKKR
jgi:integrase